MSNRQQDGADYIVIGLNINAFLRFNNRALTNKTIRTEYNCLAIKRRKDDLNEEKQRYNTNCSSNYNNSNVNISSSDNKNINKWWAI